MLRFLVLLLAAATFASAEKWPVFPPFRMIGNIYYVGDDDLASYLIVTPKGDILINTGFAYYVPEVRERLKTLHVNLHDIKILLVTHAHSDHCAAEADMKKLTGAKLMAMEQEAPLLESGGKTDYLFGSDGWFPPVKVDQTFKDGDTIALGGTVLTAHLTPGHTKGSTSYTMSVVENNREYHVVIANLPTINEGTALVHNPEYPHIAEDYQHTFDVLNGLPCDIFFASHGGQFGLTAKYNRKKAYSPDAFVDPYGYHRALDRLERAYDDDLDEQQQEEQAIENRKHFRDVIPQ